MININIIRFLMDNVPRSNFRSIIVQNPTMLSQTSEALQYTCTKIFTLVCSVYPIAGSYNHYMKPPEWVGGGGRGSAGGRACCCFVGHF